MNKDIYNNYNNNDNYNNLQNITPTPSLTDRVKILDKEVKR